MSMGIHVVAKIPRYCPREFPKVHSCPPRLLSKLLSNFILCSKWLASSAVDGNGVSRDAVASAVASAVALVPWSELLDAVVVIVCDVDIT